MIGHFCGLIKQLERNVVQMWAAEQPFVGEERFRDETKTAAWDTKSDPNPSYFPMGSLGEDV